MTSSRLLCCGLVLLLIFLQIQLWTGPNRIGELPVLEQQIASLKQDNKQAILRNQELMIEVQGLKAGGDAISTRARAELGLIKPDEIYYQVKP